nr:glycosyltransferase family 4 protein [Providencia rustigianii]
MKKKRYLIKDSLENINIFRFYSRPIKNIDKFQRALHESLLSLYAWKSIKKEITYKKFDAIIYYSPSIFFGDLVKKIKTCCHCPAYLILRDFFPQWAIDEGIIKKNSLIEKYFRYFERKSYNEANMIGVTSESNLNLFKNRFSDQYPVSILNNWASLNPIKKCEMKFSVRNNLDLKDKIIYFYGGNIGQAQDMENLMRLVKSMIPFSSAHFLFIGQGDEVNLILELAKKWNLNNFTYLPSVDQIEFKNILSEVDIGLFSLSPRHTSHNFPGKLLGYMVQSLPILGSVNKGNDLLNIINNNNAGFICYNGEDDILLKNAILLYENIELRKSLGNNSFRLLKDEYSTSSAAKNILSYLKWIIWEY